MLWHYSRLQKKLWHDAGPGYEAWSCPADDTPVSGSGPVLPLGTYTFGPLEWNDPNDAMPSGELWTRSTGPGVIAIDVANGRGIECHGGGTASPHPLASDQGIYPAEDCLRVLNRDFYHIADNLGPNDTIEYVA